VNPLFSAAFELQRFFEARAWRFCFIGGLAVQRWGEPRLTLDVDCTLLTGFGQEARYVDELLAAFVGRVDRPRDFALAHRVLLRSRLLLAGPSVLPFLPVPPFVGPPHPGSQPETRRMITWWHTLNEFQSERRLSKRRRPPKRPLPPAHGKKRAPSSGSTASAWRSALA
jgi:hypothetical protein